MLDKEQCSLKYALQYTNSPIQKLVARKKFNLPKVTWLGKKNIL